MAKTFTDRNKASEAGKKSRRGKAKRAEEWLQLRDSILGRHTNRFNKILDNLDRMDFVKAYLEVLKYFKPRLSNIEVEPPPPKELPPYDPYNLAQMSNEQLINELKLLDDGKKTDVDK